MHKINSVTIFVIILLYFGRENAYNTYVTSKFYKRFDIWIQFCDITFNITFNKSFVIFTQFYFGIIDEEVFI